MYMLLKLHYPIQDREWGGTKRGVNGGNMSGGARERREQTLGNEYIGLR